VLHSSCRGTHPAARVACPKPGTSPSLRCPSHHRDFSEKEHNELRPSPSSGLPRPTPPHCCNLGVAGRIPFPHAAMRRMCSILGRHLCIVATSQWHPPPHMWPCAACACLSLMLRRSSPIE
jgi:hypothetical protein